ncbi:hypothetical protein RBH29_05315 [Herbivorax sp. ANBcel31]|uniref:SPOCS domain-containing protein n=1 Tax=Herbivorax sp. ANBcel31 TaxID=3069754 RepID=UPI0027B52C7B|nr:SPOCS domain-containing protein [Herbivorax sp. ANBcel31]MDQ2085855.1 hypothetical protein [Herbivorax sp. ANBcel31]
MLKNYPNYNFFREKIIDEENKNIYYRKKSKKLKELNEIVEKKSTTKFIEYEIFFPPKFPALKINENITKLKNLKCIKFKSGILVEGTVLKEIVFFSPESRYIKKNRLNTCFSSLKSIVTNVPFSCFIEINNVYKDDIVQFEFAGVDENDVVDILSKPFMCSECGEKLYRALKEKIIIKISIMLLRKKTICL